MTAPKTKQPLESFGPELMAALIRGSRERLVIAFPGAEGVGKRKAHQFQRRIHTLRSRMRQEDHPDTKIVYRAKVSLFWGDPAVAEGAPEEWKEDYEGKRGALIIITPQDSEFAPELKKAGVTPIPMSESEPATAIPSPSITKPKDELDDLLDTLGYSPKPGD